MTVKGERSSPYRLNTSPHGSHRKIVGLIPDNASILDLGCSEGFIGELAQGKPCRIVGLDASRPALVLAKKWYYSVIRSELDRPGGRWPFRPGSFDVVIAADVLEHLRHPEHLLEDIRRSLRPEGLLIASIPNVARIEVRLRLLVGRFDYTETGIMDRTHLRFFTKASALQLLRAAGFEPRVVAVTGLASKVPPLRLVSGLAAYQFIVAATAKKRS